MAVPRPSTILHWPASTATGTRVRNPNLHASGTSGGYSGLAVVERFTCVGNRVRCRRSCTVVAAYAAASRIEVEGTTEVAAFVVLATGVVAGIGELKLASA